MKGYMRVIQRATLITCALGAALLAPAAHRPARANAGVNGPILAIVGMNGEGGRSPYFGLVAAGAGGVTVLVQRLPDTFGGLAPSPRGRYIAIVGGTGLWEADVDGSHLRRVLSPPTSVGAVAWSPDRFTLAYAGAGNAGGLYLTRYDGTGPRRLLATAARLGAALGPRVRDISIGRLSWSSDGRTIAANVASDLLPGNGYAVLLVDAATGRVRSAIRGVFDASFSPAAPALAYLSPAPARAGQPPEGFTLSVSDATGGHPRALFSTPYFVEDPVWSPDGASLAYGWTGERVEKFFQGEAEIHAVNVATGAVRTIATWSDPAMRGRAFISLAWSHIRE